MSAKTPITEGTIQGLCSYDDPQPCAHKFTGKERDPDTGSDYFGARWSRSSMARFYSPDPVGGQLSNPQSLNRYTYVLNNPLKWIDPTGMIVEWNDSKKGKDGRTSAQRAFERRLAQLLDSKNDKDRANGAALRKTYDQLQQSKAIFEVKNQGGSEASHGDITYQGHDHFTINLAGNPAYALSDNQRLAHEFEHGRQVLDHELSFQFTSVRLKCLRVA